MFLSTPQMAGYRREELLDGDDDETLDNGNSGGHLVFSSNLTSIGNPHFSSSRTLMLDDAQPTATEELLGTNANANQNSTAAVLKDLGLLGTSQPSPQRSLTQQQHSSPYRQATSSPSLGVAGGVGGAPPPMENFSISFISNGAYAGGRKRFFWDRLTAFEKLLSSVILLLGLVILTLALTLLIQPTPLLQVHLNKDEHMRE